MTIKTKSKYQFSKDIKHYIKEKDFRFRKYPGENIGAYSSIEHLVDFVEKEMLFWGEIEKSLSLNSYSLNAGPVTTIKNEFNRIYRLIKGSQKVDATNENKYKETTKNLDEALESLASESFPYVYSTNEISKFIQSYAQKKNRELIFGLIMGYFDTKDKALNYNINNLSDKNFIFGLNLGSRFRFPELHKEVDENFIGRTKQLINEINNEHVEFVKMTDEKTVEIDKNFNELKEETKTERYEYSEKLEDLINEKAIELNNLESLYNEKLKLSEPAQYWDKASKEYEKIGQRWKYWAVVTGLVFISILTIILTFAETDNILSLSSVKFTVILTVIISIGYLLVNLFIKLATSNYHLANDAKERYRLTYVYLSLLKSKENMIGEEERTIVFQSLFARTDSGLIKSETGLQIPSNQQIHTLFKS